MQNIHSFAPSSLRSPLGGNCRKCSEPESAHAPEAADRFTPARISIRDLGSELEKLKAHGRAARVELVISDADGDGDQDVQLLVDGATVGAIELGTIVDGFRRIVTKAAAAVVSAVKRVTKRKPKAKGKAARK